MSGIIWLASYPKSGNTWLRAFLHNFLRNPAESYDINRLTDFSVGESQVAWYRKHDPRPASEYTIEDVLRLRPLVQRDIAARQSDSVFVKTHNAFLDSDGVSIISNEVTAGAIYVVRNPLDVAVSYSHHAGKSIDEMIDFMANDRAMTDITPMNVYEYLSSWSLHTHSWTRNPNPTLHVVRYEDLLDAPLRSFGGIAKFLGLSPPRERLEKAIKLSSFKVLQAQEKRKGFVERSRHTDAFFREGKAGQWKKVLTPAQIDRIRGAHETEMRRFGYW